MILQVLIVMVAGWLQRHQQKVIAYLLEENRVLKVQLRSRRLCLTETERRRLAALAHPFGRQRLKEVATIAIPETLLRWYKRGLPQRFALHAHEPDHIVPHQHGGESHLQNLAWACLRCNRYKEPNVGSFDPATGQLVPFFNPRTQEWVSHFAWEGATIQPLTPEGRVTVTILRLNTL
jgi:hypothetical protein